MNPIFLVIGVVIVAVILWKYKDKLTGKGGDFPKQYSVGGKQYIADTQAAIDASMKCGHANWAIGPDGKLQC